MTNVYLNILQLNLYQTMAGSQCKQVNFADLDLKTDLFDLDLPAVLPGDFRSDETLPSGILASDISPIDVPFVTGSMDQAILQPAYKIISYIRLTCKDIPDEIPPSDNMLTDNSNMDEVTLQHLHKGIRA